MHGKLAVDLLLRNEPGDGGLLIAQLIDKLQRDRLPAGKDPAVGGLFERRIVHVAPAFHQIAEPGVGILHKRIDGRARFRTRRLEAVGRGLQRR